MNKRGTEKKPEKGMEIGTNIDGKKTERINKTDQRKGKRKVTSQFLSRKHWGCFVWLCFDHPALGLFLHIADVVNFVPLRVREYLSR